MNVELFDESNQVVTYEDYMNAREDWESWLSPLLSKTLVWLRLIFVDIVLSSGLGKFTAF